MKKDKYEKKRVVTHGQKRLQDQGVLMIIRFSLHDLKYRIAEVNRNPLNLPHHCYYCMEHRWDPRKQTVLGYFKHMSGVKLY